MLGEIVFLIVTALLSFGFVWVGYTACSLKSRDAVRKVIDEFYSNGFNPEKNYMELYEKFMKE